MNTLNNAVQNLVQNRVNEMCQEYGRQLKSYIEYEYTIMNMELASSYKKHGYDFKVIPHQLIEHINVNVSQVGKQYSVTVSIGPEGQKGCSDQLLEFFNIYVMANAQARMQIALPKG